MSESDALPFDVRCRIGVLEKLPAELRTALVVVHAHHGCVVEEPEILARQVWIRLAGEVEYADVFTGCHAVPVDGELVAQIVRQRPAEHLNPADPPAGSPQM